MRIDKFSVPIRKAHPQELPVAGEPQAGTDQSRLGILEHLVMALMQEMGAVRSEITELRNSIEANGGQSNE